MANLVLAIWSILAMLSSPIAEGKATRYDPGVMDVVVRNRIEWGHIDPSVPHIGYIAVVECKYVGDTAWIGLPGGDLVGPYLVADCGNAAHREHQLESGLAADLSWEVACDLGVIDAPLYGVKVYVGENFRPETPNRPDLADGGDNELGNQGTAREGHRDRGRGLSAERWRPDRVGVEWN